MKKKILAIGGSYFIGRVFSILASQNAEQYELHVVNRGNYPLNLPGVAEYRCDRAEPQKIAAFFPDSKFDALIDFCAYNPGDIEPMMAALKDKIGHYIYISTSSVYAVGKQGAMVETDPVLEPVFNDPNAAYVTNKMLLEKELTEAAAHYGVPETILRPTFIYGPYNYAPREAVYIEQVVRGNPLPCATDAVGKFQMVYVTDIARALQLCAGDQRAYHEIFNLSAPEVLDNERIFAELEKLSGKPVALAKMTLREAMERNIPIPFPTVMDELYSGQKFADTFDFSYSTFEEGFAKTYRSFHDVFSSIVASEQR